MTYSKGLILFFAMISFYSFSYGTGKVIESRLGGFYSISNRGGTTLTFSSKNKVFLLQKTNGTLLVKQKQKLTFYIFKTIVNGKEYTISRIFNPDDLQPISSLSIANIPEQFDASNCAKENHLIRLDSDIKKLIEYSDSQDYSNFAENISEKCDQMSPRHKVIFNRTLKNHFSNKSSLHTCLSSKNLKGWLEKNTRLFDDIIRLTNGYLSDLAAIKNEKSPNLRIRCEFYDDEQKYNAKFSSGEIIIPIVKDALPGDDCRSIDAIFTHEYFHKVGLKDEKNIKAIERFCLEVTNPKILENPKCAAQFSEMTSQSRTLQEVDHKIEKVIKAEQAKLTPVVQKELEKAPLKEVKVSDATWSSLTNDPNATIPTAERNSIAATMNSNFESMSGSLNRALGATQTPALAANESPASASGSSSSASDSSSATPSRSPASSYDRTDRETYSSANSKTTRNSKASTDSSAPSNDFHTVEEYIVDSKNAKNPRSFNIQSGRSGTSAGVEQDKSLGTTPRQAMAATNSGEVQTGSTRGNADRTRNSEVARSAQGGEFSGVNEGSAATGSALSAQGPAPARAPGKRQPASQNQGGGSASAAFSGGSSVSSLKEQSLIRGSDYESITSNYRRRDFSNELSQQGVSIYVEKQGMSLGRGDAKIKFIDNGEYLRRAEGN